MSEPVALELTPGRLIGANYPCFIIAEIGQNHQGDLNVAKRLILAAKRCGADCVKFQKSSLEHKFTKKALQSKYESPNSFGETYGEHKKYLEFSESDYLALAEYAREVGIPLTASAMDEVSVDFLKRLKVPFIKIGSGDFTNPIVLSRAGELTHIPLVVSSGMSNMEDVWLVYGLLKSHREKVGNNFALLQCTSSYPTPPEAANLSVITAYKKAFPDVHIGYSGHEENFILTLGAVALGARIIERHFTLDNSMKGSDHKCSLNVESFGEMVRSIRILERGLGTPEKVFQDCEKECHVKLGKSIVAARGILKGHIFKEEDLCVKVSTPIGISPLRLKELVGKMCLSSLDVDDPITEENVSY